MPVVKNGPYWTCTSGGLTFSESLGAKLDRAFSSSVREGRKPLGSIGLAVWYCPSCCVELDGAKKCPECGKDIQKFLFALIELHPHADGNGRWI